MLMYNTSAKATLYLILASLVVITGCKSSGRLSDNNTFKPEKHEVVPAASIPCFAGAYYRKAVSSFDTWTGISGTVVLGQPIVDETRLDEKTAQPLDNFSVYMGGNAGGKQEVDAGLTWAFTHDAAGRQSIRRRSWRPFWRTKIWSNAPPSNAYDWFPGDTVQMEVILIAPKRLRLIVKDAGFHPRKSFSADFDADGFTPEVTRQFKRVNAIDQFHNEGKPVKPTGANVINSEWLNSFLLRGNKKLAMNKFRYTDMRCSDATHIVVTPVNVMKGAEKINIFGMPQ